ncbi:MULTISPECIES: preprotein translocase subunit YajC [Syntrophothermus]|uniref:Preprotein translocase, YajC subunit n=1 Tax=Syntrophothermus lipocalidus (strain DSM 12680 / TGB-C1) TaxID=643648 RepID=D7CLE5_SYNLT|nr:MULTISPECIES: preprotein translocase subunit YajC [Syntrophothermus]ADI01530.1 preprotein translocase, YajC subunit [Syntrophothermus lipocalidus DSM 12680]HOV43024.1 preprotein translocase subunit YajC [Syntrophothermus lipocalidus]
MEWKGLAAYILTFLVAFYLLIVLPRQRQEKKHQQFIEDLKVHDKVVTISGILGEVRKVKDTTIILRVAEGVELEVLKKAIAYKQE